MANGSGSEAPESETLLVAYVTAYLTTGESIDLSPFFDKEDVKSKVSDLVADWAKSGYLLRGKLIYPWHQVKLIEAASVAEMPRDALERDPRARDDMAILQFQQEFWKTKKARKKSDEPDSHDTGDRPDTSKTI